MRWKWSHVLTSLALAGMLIFAGCADDDDNGGGGPGPQPEPLVDTWNGLAGSVGQLGVDEMRYFFRADSTYTFYQRAGTTEIRENGTWDANPDSIYFDVNNVDNVPTDSTYALWYDLSSNDDTLRVRYLYDQLYTIVYVRQD